MTGMRDLRIEAARSALSRGDLETVRRFGSTLVTDNPSDAEGHFLLGVAEASSGGTRSGIKHLVRAVAIDPQGEYRAQLARLFIMVRRDGDAAATLRDAEQALPRDALSRDTMGCVYARLGNHEAALTHFDEAVTLAPGNTEYR
ncbi:MAG: tetratricopeptide repeat protein, partial [Burkholderiales bacterium]